MNNPSAVVDDDPQITRARERVGMVLQDKWTLDALLGVGGMAAVYGATHRNGKRVAVKMLHAEVSHDKDVKQRFLLEGYAANAIQHEGAVSVLDDDVAPDGSAFIVMELLEGETVEERSVRSGHQLPAREVLAIVEQLLDVLAAAHAKDVVHRDIKPENLFITRAGQVKVLDFGIAKVYEAQRTKGTETKVGVVMGTPAFMAPEQARARWDEVDGRTDLWAVGATMFTLLTGKHVHEARSGNEQLILSATTPAPSIAKIEPSVPPAVAAIVDRALAFERVDRWPNAAAMQAAVAEVVGALGRAELELTPMPPRRATLSSVLSSFGVTAPPASGVATMIDSGAGTSAAAWAKERETREAEVAKLKASLGDLALRQSTARKLVNETQAKIEAGRAERTSLEEWFKRQVGTRTAAVEDARKLVRMQLVAIGRQAASDQVAFGAELEEARTQIAKLERAAESAQRDVKVHAAALEAHDPRALRLGVMLLGVLAVLLVALLAAPVVWRATRVVDPPAPTPAPVFHKGR